MVDEEMQTEVNDAFADLGDEGGSTDSGAATDSGGSSSGSDGGGGGDIQDDVTREFREQGAVGGSGPSANTNTEQRVQEQATESLRESEESGGGGGAVETVGDIASGVEDAVNTVTGGGGGGSGQEQMAEADAARGDAEQAATAEQPDTVTSTGSQPAAEQDQQGSPRQQRLDTVTDRAENNRRTDVDISDLPASVRGGVRAVRQSARRGVVRSRRRGQQQQDLGNFEVGIPGTNRTVEGVTQDASEQFTAATDEFGGGAGEVTGGAAAIAQGEVDVNFDPSRIDADPTTGPAFSAEVTGSSPTVRDTTAEFVSGGAGLANVPGGARAVDEAAEAGAFAFSGISEGAGQIDVRPENVDVDPSNQPAISASGAGKEILNPPQRLQRRGRQIGRRTANEFFRIEPENFQPGEATEPVIQARPEKAEEIASGAALGLASVAAGRAAGPALGRARRFAGDRIRTAGADVVDISDVSSEAVARNLETDGQEGERFPGADDPKTLREDPATAIEEQAQDRTPDVIEDRFAGDGPVLKKALDVEPDSTQTGNRGFQTREGDFETPGSFVSSDLSPNFLRLDEGSSGTQRLAPGIPSGGGNPTGVLIRTDIENPNVETRPEFNQEILDAQGDTTARAVDPSLEGAGGADEIEAVIPPGAEFQRAAGGGRLASIARRFGVGSDVAVRIPTPDGDRRVPLRPVEAETPDGGRTPDGDVEAEAETGAGAVESDADLPEDGIATGTDRQTTGRSEGNSLDRFVRSPEPNPDDPPAPVAPNANVSEFSNRSSGVTADSPVPGITETPTGSDATSGDSDVDAAGGFPGAAGGSRPSDPALSGNDGVSDPPAGSSGPDTSESPPSPTGKSPSPDSGVSPPPSVDISPPFTTPGGGPGAPPSGGGSGGGSRGGGSGGGGSSPPFRPVIPGSPNNRPRRRRGDDESDEEPFTAESQLGEESKRTETVVAPLAEIDEIEADVGLTDFTE